MTTDQDRAKQAAARAAAQLIQPGMTVGLGTGTTARFFIEALAERVASEGLSVRGVPTSRASEKMARQRGIPVVPLSTDCLPDLNVDGADEVGPGLALIKGGGGALVREKLVAVASREWVVVADSSKAVAMLGRFPVPVAVVPYGRDATQARLHEAFGVPADLRAQNGVVVVTDDGLNLIDLHFGAISDPARLEQALKQVVGVVEVGLFVGLASRLLLGNPDGSVEERGV